MIDQQTKEELHQQLLQERQRLEGEISNLESRDIRSDTFLMDEDDAYDQHPADAGSEMFEREKNMTILRTLQASLQAVNQALHRYDEGTYGLCERCGKPIPEKRLRAMPEATHDVQCQEILEHEANRLARRQGI